ncbi:MAG: diguanylate cyclase [Bermanella sp.]
MFSISMEKGPALTLLYAVYALASILLSITHYWFGHYDILLINLVSIAVLSFAAIFSNMNRNQAYGKYINVFTLTSLALLMQYQLSFQPDLTIYWIYTFPIFAYFSLPLSWAFALNITMLFSSFSQLIIIYDFQVCFRLMLIYILIDSCSLCYAYLNTEKQKRLLELAVTDYQSGAYNSRFLLSMLNQEISRSLVTNRTLSLFAMSIDDYQQILEIHGRDISVKVLKEFRIKLVTLLRAGDEIFYNGKGTFYILLPNCPMEGVMVLRERLQQHLDEIHWGDVGELQLNTGLATLKNNENAEDFLQRASEQVHNQQQMTLRMLAFNH